MNEKDKRAIAENFDDVNLENLEAFIKSEDPLALNDGKAYIMVCEHLGPCEVKLNPKSYEIVAELLID